LKESKRFKYEKLLRNHPLTTDKLKFWTPQLCASQPKIFDFIVTVSLRIAFVIFINALSYSLEVMER
jgi:hypothetical protein